MLNPDAELNRLRWSLSNKDWLPNEVDEIVDQASTDVNNAILDVVSNAVAEATDYAIEIGADDFVEDIDVVDVGGGFQIVTKSGKTDYTKPARQMLPDLLKNAKVAEDGSRYKVIPVGARNKSVTPQKDIFSAMRATMEAQREARANLLQNNLDQRSARAQAMAKEFRNIVDQRLQMLHQRRSQRTDTGTHNTGKVDFATASSKQDPTTQWVIPEEKMDMTGYIMDMNKRIEESIYESVSFIIQSYEQEFA